MQRLVRGPDGDEDVDPARSRVVRWSQQLIPACRYSRKPPDLSRTLDDGRWCRVAHVLDLLGCGSADLGDALLRRFGGAASRVGLLFSPVCVPAEAVPSAPFQRRFSCFGADWADWAPEGAPEGVLLPCPADRVSRGVPLLLLLLLLLLFPPYPGRILPCGSPFGHLVIPCFCPLLQLRLQPWCWCFVTLASPSPTPASALASDLALLVVRLVRLVVGGCLVYVASEP
ncbi:hypothetical protein NDU88_001518 [Pleurodeles waltl]|uniref:Uncharacterized protein n=1 Tax=Pleurodeles waltl TaxID=8319 RepID=A0AAV7UUY3_PLEWA|nr:hypothetical protein NDU88_001518 [Pleurodeles waltl]